MTIYRGICIIIIATYYMERCQSVKQQRSIKVQGRLTRAVTPFPEPNLGFI